MRPRGYLFETEEHRELRDQARRFAGPGPD
jgi:hypothetical protein